MKNAIQGWKDTYYGAAAFMKECGEYALSQGYIENPWGRRRFFARSTDLNEQEAVKREASNWPIQSTVSDTILLSMYLIAENRAKYGVDCKIINPIHDALMLSTPDDQIDKTKKLLKETMGNIAIPVKYKPLILGIDISEFKRW
jgi:DNA polymerase I-like protein with 3'-5' exonuclease and polymerase domains